MRDSIIQLTAGQLSIGVFVILLLSTSLQWLITKWFASRIEKSIQHEYDKKLENYKFKQLQRQKAERLASLFSKWIKYRGHEEDILSKVELIDYYEELTRMSMEISMWIEDEVLLSDVMSRLQLEGDKDIRILLTETRKLILENPNDYFDPQKIIIWPNNDCAERLWGR